ncbi:recombinase family protein [Massilia sp. YIM B04103]|uniref:recombinase family protein n=1 Tax=Massilia sp. YIM B04103 TaxID=2963106 RepID=UPI00210DAA7E|nr:recombinase family protein [Massilia sp. YIM B04103]
MSHIAYYRVSSKSQSIDAQRAALSNGRVFDREYSDEGVSGAVVAANRPGFAAMLNYIREGDTLHVYAIDRLGRDAIDVQTTIKALLAKGGTVEIQGGVGQIAPTGVGRMIVAMLAQMAEMERERITERTTNGKELAAATFAATGKTHKGKTSLGGRPVKADAAEVKAWKEGKNAEGTKKSISETVKEFGLSESTVKRYCKT